MILWPSVASFADLCIQHDEFSVAELLRDAEHARQCQQCLESLVMAIKEMKEHIRRRSQLTWPYCQA